MADHLHAPTPPEPAPVEVDREMTFWERWGEVFLAVTVIAVGVVVLVETRDIRITRAVARVSPRAIPQIVGWGLVLVGIWYAVDAIRTPRLPSGGEDAEDVDLSADTNWSAIGIIAIGLLAYALLIERAGFAISSAVLFVISAFAMGSRRLLRDAAIGLVLGVAIFFVFDSWLGVRLPEGWLVEQLG